MGVRWWEEGSVSGCEVVGGIYFVELQLRTFSEQYTCLPADPTPSPDCNLSS